HQARGEISDGLTVVDEALEFARTTGECYHAAEGERVKGRLLLDTGPDGAAAAEHCFRRAIDIARAQGGRGWELRSTVDLAQLLDRQGRASEARDVLDPIYTWFTEGFDTPDLVDARAVLATLDPRPRSPVAAAGP